MRTTLIVGVVILAHCAAVGGFVLIQGCGTTATVGPPPEPIMPPSAPLAVEPASLPSAPLIPVPAPPARSWPNATTSYVVKKGDCLSAIAGRFDLNVAEIMALNSMTDPDRIFEGQKIVLPGNVNLDTPAPVVRESAPVELTGGDVYVVKPGDCLSVIASRFGVTVASIREANSLAGDRILVGQKLAIKGAKKIPLPAVDAADRAQEEPSDLDVDLGMDTAPITDAPEPVPPEPVTDAAGMRTYVVGENEDLYSVGLIWNVSVDRLKEVNNLTDTTLTPGQRLKIPTAE